MAAIKSVREITLNSIMAVAEGETVALPYAKARDLYATLTKGDPQPCTRHAVATGLSEITGRRILLV